MADRELTPLSDAQWEVMKIVWEHEEVSAFEVREILAERRDVSRTTVRTLLERMEEKGWLTHRVVGRTHFFSAVVPRDVSLGKRVVDLLDKVCGGKPETMMTALMQHRGLSADEVERIQAMLNEARSKTKSRRPIKKGKRS